MLKKVVLATLLVGLIGILVTGGIIRTLNKTGNVAEAGGQGYGRGRSEQSEHSAATPGQGLGAENQAAGQTGNGKGRGYGQSTGVGQSPNSEERQYRNNEALPQEWSVVEGTVLQTPEAGGDLVVGTEDGDVKVGTGPGYMEAQGFALQVGEQVQVQGYWEDDELKATQVTRLQDVQSITLRDESGRPAWAGSGKRAAEQQAAGTGAGQSQGGRGQGGQGQGSSGRGREGTAAEGRGVAEAQVGWLTAEGTVVRAGGEALVVKPIAGPEIVVEGRAWRFVQEQELALKPNDQVSLVGFYEEDGLGGSGESFTVSRIDNLTSGQSVVVREENGRPMWAGQGRRGG